MINSDFLFTVSHKGSVSQWQSRFVLNPLSGKTYLGCREISEPAFAFEPEVEDDDPQDIYDFDVEIQSDRPDIREDREQENGRNHDE